MLQGTLEFYINNLELPLDAVDFVIVNSNEIHSIHAEYPNTTIVVQIPAGCLAGYIGEGNYAVFSKQTEDQNLELVQLIGRLHQEYMKKEFAYELMVQKLFYELLYLLVTRFMHMEEDQGTFRQKRCLDRLSEIT